MTRRRLLKRLCDFANEPFETRCVPEIPLVHVAVLRVAEVYRPFVARLWISERSFVTSMEKADSGTPLYFRAVPLVG